MFYWQFNRAWCIKEVQRLVRVAGRGYSDGARNLEVMLESLSGGRRREIQEDGIVMEVKNILFKCSRRQTERQTRSTNAQQKLPPPTKGVAWVTTYFSIRIIRSKFEEEDFVKKEDRKELKDSLRDADECRPVSRQRSTRVCKAHNR